MTLTEFLTARIAEDEEAGRRGSRHNAREVYANDNYGCLLVDPARVLAECEAKRRIVAEYRIAESLIDTLTQADQSDVAHWEERSDALREAIDFLAVVYADHPDYDEAWRP